MVTEAHRRIPLAGWSGPEAVRHLAAVIAPTQGERARKAGLTGRQYAPGGREHRPLRLVELDQSDVDALSAARLGDPLAAEPVRDVLAELAPLLMNAPDSRRHWSCAPRNSPACSPWTRPARYGC